MRPSRLLSIDAIRGCTVAAMLLVNDAGDWSHVYPWLEHARWNGCTPADFIFPFFLLIVGVSIELAYAPRLDQSGAHARLAGVAIFRGLRIVLLGVVLHAVAACLIPNRDFRLPGVLQRIGICFSVATLIAIHVRSARVQWCLIAAILLGYWWLMCASPWASPLLPDINLADRLDTILLGHFAYQFDARSGIAHDPEGVLSTLPALATVLTGMRAGGLLRTGRRRELVWLGMVSLVAGLCWSPMFPFNKQLWTSSFVLWTAGWGILVIAAVHEWSDIRGHRVPGVALGVNAVVIYAGSWLAVCLLEWSGIMPTLYPLLFGDTIGRLWDAEAASLAFALCFTASFAWLAYRMHRVGLHISI